MSSKWMALWILFGLISSACTPVPVPDNQTVPPPIAVSETPGITFSSRTTLTGVWIGAATRPDGSTASIQLNFDDPAAELSIEPKTQAWKLEVVQNGEGVNFSAAGESNDPFALIEFAGKLTDGNLSGELTWDAKKSPIVFLPISSVAASLLEKYEGLYRFESGRALSIIVSPEYSSGGLRFFSQTLMMTDFDSGALRGLYPMDDSTFLIGALRVIGAPFNGRIQFKKDDQGNVQGLMWWETPNDLFSSPVPGFYASRVLYTSEDVTFASQDGTKLAGRFSLPQSNTPLPAFMMLHGSEQGTRDNFGNKVMAHYMISNGFVILNYDKRGVGDSEGTYQEAASPSNLQKHAEDAIAGVEYLASRPEIDAKHISLIGFSQAGWVIPLAASQSTALSHFVILSGPVASTSHESLFSGYANDGDSIASYDDAKITQQLRDLNPGGFDPLPILAEVDQPGLWLWGSVDKSVPVTYSAENLQGLIDSGKSNFSYDVLPQGDHNLNQSPNGLFSEIPYSPRVLFYSPLTEWLKTHMPVAKE